MKILFFTDNFPPEVNAPATRTFEHCIEWAKKGHKVTVVTCVPNFPKGYVFEGYVNKLWQSEWMDGIRVIRVWSFISPNKGFAKRILDYQSFMVSAAIAGLLLKGMDVIIGTSPQFFTVCAAWFVSFIKRIPFVFEVRDLWPESITAVGAIKNSMMISLLERVELFLYGQALLIITVTHSFAENLKKRGVESNKIYVVTNGADLTLFKSVPKDLRLIRNYCLADKFVVGYVGTHGLAHHLVTVLQAAEKIKKLPDGDSIVFLFLGEGACKQSLMDFADRHNLDNVIFIDAVSKKEITRYWSLLDVSLIHLKETTLFHSVIPSKLFECMAMGIPVLHGVKGESAELVVKEQIGVLFEPENFQSLCIALLKLKDNPFELRKMGKNCLSVSVKYNRKILATKMIKIIENSFVNRIHSIKRENLKKKQ